MVINKSISFEEHINSNNENFEILTKEFPKITIASEYINDVFDQIFGDRFQHDNEILWQYSTAKMLFGIHYCWLNYFIQTAQGYNDIGLMVGRRAIEYSCYISKIRGKENMATLWNEKTVDKTKLSKFSSKFSVPQKYFSPKYEHLKPLLVFHNYASEFGVHGNHATLVSKLRHVEFKNKISMSFQDNPKGIPSSCTVAIQIGSFIIDALMHDLKDNIRDYEEFKNKLSIKKQIVRDAIIQGIEFNDGKDISYDLVKKINNEDMSEINKLYDELKKEYNAT
jgi:hypothetical protein